MRREPIRRVWSLRSAACDAATVFAAVADVERYSEFLPGIGARVVRRDGARWLVENSFRLGPLTTRFRSVAEANPPDDLTIVSNDGPWRDLAIRWRVSEDGRQRVLTCEATMEFRSRALDILARASMTHVERTVAAAFDRRLTSLAKDKGR